MTLRSWMVAVLFILTVASASADSLLGKMPLPLVLQNTQTQGVPDTSYASALKLYAGIVHWAFPRIDEKRCGGELLGVLASVARIPSPVYNLDNEKLLGNLRTRNCVDKHFYFYKTVELADRLQELCTKPPLILTWVSGVWVLRVNDLLDDQWDGMAPACAGRLGQFELFLQQIHRVTAENDFGFRTGEPYILDLRDNGGGSTDALRLMLNSAISPWPHTKFYQIYDGNGWRLYTSDEKVGLFKCPQAILVNKGTASAGEILADTVLSMCPETISIGQQTYGKFAGTSFLPLGISRVRVSMEVYFTGGRTQSLNYIGLQPQRIVPAGTELEAAIAILNLTSGLRAFQVQ